MVSVRLLATIAVVSGVVAVVPSSAAPSLDVARSARAVFETTEPQECLEPTPAAVGVPVPLADPLVIDVLVLADDIAAADAERELKNAGLPYRAIGLDLRITVRAVHFARTGEVEYANGKRDTASDVLLIEQARQSLPGARRPDGFDVVYVLTAKDLYSDRPGGREYATVGSADCIGGVRYDRRAFAVGERRPEIPLYGLRYAADGSAIVAAHEIGHLFGAHHHYATCGQGAMSVIDRAIGVCTTMWPEVAVAGLQFSTTNAAVVRGHAEEFVSPDS